MKANNVIITDHGMTVEFADGRAMHVPLSWYPRLQHATEQERQHWQLLGDGYAIEWLDIDEHIGIEGLLAGCKSGESEASLRRWMLERAK